MPYRLLFFVSLFALVALIGKSAAFFGISARPSGTSASAVAAPGKPAAPTSSQRTGPSDLLALPKGRDGHFRADAVIGGKRLQFVVDTGASIVAITHEDAARLGLNPAPAEFTAPMQTANGVVRAARVRLAAVSVGALTVQDVSAVVMPRGVLAENLLGMSFLSRLRRFEFRTGQLLLEH